MDTLQKVVAHPLFEKAIKKYKEVRKAELYQEDILEKAGREEQKEHAFVQRLFQSVPPTMIYRMNVETEDEIADCMFYTAEERSAAHEEIKKLAGPNLHLIKIEFEDTLEEPTLELALELVQDNMQEAREIVEGVGIAVLLGLSPSAPPDNKAEPAAKKPRLDAPLPKTAGVTFRPLIFTGPSGAGKSTLIKRLLAQYPEQFSRPITHTTREPRPGEVNGVDYHFTTEEKFGCDIRNQNFAEFTHVHGNSYGVSHDAIRAVRDSGKTCILDLDLEGCKSFRRMPDCAPRVVFVAPPSMFALDERLRGRGDAEDSIELRLRNAAALMNDYDQRKGFYALRIVNDNIDDAYAALVAYINSGACRPTAPCGEAATPLTPNKDI